MPLPGALSESRTGAANSFYCPLPEQPLCASFIGTHSQGHFVRLHSPHDASPCLSVLFSSFLSVLSLSVSLLCIHYFYCRFPCKIAETSTFCLNLFLCCLLHSRFLSILSVSSPAPQYLVFQSPLSSLESY